MTNEEKMALYLEIPSIKPATDALREEWKALHKELCGGGVVAQTGRRPYTLKQAELLKKAVDDFRRLQDENAPPEVLRKAEEDVRQALHPK